MQLKGKVVLITGAASGIGRATALKCATEEAKVIATDVNLDAGRVALNAGGIAEAIALDVTSEAQAAGSGSPLASSASSIPRRPRSVPIIRLMLRSA